MTESRKQTAHSKSDYKRLKAIGADVALPECSEKKSPAVSNWGFSENLPILPKERSDDLAVPDSAIKQMNLFPTNTGEGGAVEEAMEKKAREWRVAKAGINYDGGQDGFGWWRDEQVAAFALSRQQEWVSVTERLPEPLETIWLAIPTWVGEPRQFEWHFEAGWYVLPDPQDRDAEPMFCTEADDYALDNVHAWQKIVCPDSDAILAKFDVREKK